MIKHSVAAYPESFLGCVVSPTKICLQFQDVSAKLRFKDGANYIKLPTTEWALPIVTTGTAVDILAVGNQMPNIEALQLELIAAYVKYGKLYSSVYRDTYGTEFIDFLKRAAGALNNAVSALDREDRT